MSENRISVKQYIENEDLLEVNYTPYTVKKEIVEAVLSEVIKEGDMRTIDTALLHRVSCEIFIEAITNINMSELSEDGIGGYDQLCMYDAMDELISNFETEYLRFYEILEYKILDFNKLNNSTGAILISLKNKIRKMGNEIMDTITSKIKSIDVKESTETLKKMIAENLEKYKEK